MTKQIRPCMHLGISPDAPRGGGLIVGRFGPVTLGVRIGGRGVSASVLGRGHSGGEVILHGGLFLWEQPYRLAFQDG